ncbi:MAG TPA: c-type cytochrome [Anaerolineales bacterium]|nr:c-type cytochrome [Anaerolineales bacterium]
MKSLLRSLAFSPARSIVLSLSLVLTLFLTTACASLAQDITPPPGYEYIPPPPTQDIMYYPSVPPNPVAGKVIFAEKCQPCHGEQGLGNGPDANDLPNPVSPIGTAELARQSYPSEWFRVVTEGRIDRFMPPFLSLTERQRWDVIAHVYTLSAPEETVARGQELFQENCVACHGETGLGDGPDAVNFTNGVTSFGDQLLMSERSKADLLEGMIHPNLPEIPAVTIGLSESDRWAITDYLRNLTFAPPEEEIASDNPLAPSGSAEDTSGSAEDTSGLEEEVVSPGEGETAEAQPEVEAVATGQGVFSGQVVNISGGEIPSDLEVVLHGFDQFQEVISITTTVETGGTFRFDGVEIPAGRAYILTVDYKNTTYTSELAVVEAGVNEYVLPVSIYETDTNTSGLVVDRLHVLFEFISEEQVRVAELVIITNLSDRVIVPNDANEPAMTFALPPGASNLQFQEGALGRDFVETADGFGDLRAIVPGQGQHQVLFSFDMPYDRGLEILQPFHLPVQNLVVLAPDVGVKVEGNGLVSGGIQDVQGVPYELFTGGALPEDGQLVLSLSGQPDLGGSNPVAAGSSSNLAIGLGALGVAVLGAGIWLFRRSNANGFVEDEFDEEDEEEPLDALPDGMDTESLMDAIIALDDYFKAGELPEEAYLQRRAVLKEQLRKLLAEERR